MDTLNGLRTPGDPLMPTLEMKIETYKKKE